MPNNDLPYDASASTSTAALQRTSGGRPRQPHPDRVTTVDGTDRPVVVEEGVTCTAKMRRVRRLAWRRMAVIGVCFAAAFPFMGFAVAVGVDWAVQWTHRTNQHTWIWDLVMTDRMALLRHMTLAWFTIAAVVAWVVWRRTRWQFYLDGRCQGCGHSGHAWSSDACPECGYNRAEGDAPPLLDRKTSRSLS